MALCDTGYCSFGWQPVSLSKIKVMISVIKKLWAHPDSKQMDSEGSMIIDVRTPGEFKEGHLKGSINIPLDDIANHINDFKNADRKIILICRSGARSGRATKLLQSHGIDAYNGGAWQTFSSN